ncbi:triose-phosphate isomerase [uncultured Tateyamaria sp.]|uniref:triose-phosphate isomerase n=1 Tax=uncultured Tateyamaria sp. TaxID=455651 RepID=UPI00261946C2|nr:triose-phosphate isomerase [uncultured Tateyamaria sp.]
MARKLAAGNWKMNGDLALVDGLATLAGNQSTDAPQIVICPPHTLLAQAAKACENSAVEIGGQDCRAEAKGAYTGDIAASMIAETGATHVIVGHSERRDGHHETNPDIRAKAQAAWAAGLTAILCIGESEAEREGSDTLTIIADQLQASLPDNATAENTVIAYEPIWAIGTGKVPTLAQIIETHDMLRAELTARLGDEGAKITLLYGGSVKPTNAAEIFQAENVNGALVGGASLKPTDFQPIIDALAAS